MMPALSNLPEELERHAQAGVRPSARPGMQNIERQITYSDNNLRAMACIPKIHRAWESFPANLSQCQRR
jgi:hypothetical protein